MTDKTLPEQIPVFPLTGTILLPRGHLPLNIFEPRYKEMIEFAIEKDGIIGMVQPLGSVISSSMKNNDQFGTAEQGRQLYSIGCAGIITEIKETAPGQYFIILTGMRRFKIKTEIPLKHNFREVLADYGPFGKDGDEILEKSDKIRKTLLATLKKYFRFLDMNVDLTPFNDIGDEELVNSVSMLLPFEASEKQLVLETISLEERAELAIQIMIFNMKDARSSAPQNIH